MMWVGIVVGLALGTYAMRIAGPVIGQRWTPGLGLSRLFAVAPVVLLVSLAFLSALHGEGSPDSAVTARVIGVAVAVGLSFYRCSMWVVVLAAAGTTAGLRLLGMG